METIADLILIRDTIRVAIRMEEIESMLGAPRAKERPLTVQTRAFLQQAQIADLLDSLRAPEQDIAALAAAAPELLSALKAIVQETVDCPAAQPYSADSYLPKHLIELAQAAISKAEGVAA